MDRCSSPLCNQFIVHHSSILILRVAGLYIHIPFCAQRCVYCDFYFVTSLRDTAAFTRAACEEIAHYGRRFGEKEPIDTIYVGGGTPSRLPLPELATIFDSVKQAFQIAGDVEITLEANPEDCDHTTLLNLRGMGVNRLSLGVQSFFDAELEWMNRAHDGPMAERALQDALEIFDHVSSDLIFGIPGQPFEHWGANLEKALRLGAGHFSCYSLTIEPKTPLAKQVKRGLVVPETDETLRERFLFTHDYLEEHGLEHYEISSFSKPGQRSRHNSAYWTHENYIGIGPSAHSFWRNTRSWAERWENIRNLKTYIALLDGRDIPVDTEDRLGQDELADEFVVLSLRRLQDGLDLNVLQNNYGLNLWEEKRETLERLEDEGLLIADADSVRLTVEGALVADSVGVALVPA